MTSLSKLAFLALVAMVQGARNDGISLVIGPTCGTLSSTATSVKDVNAGVGAIANYKTIVGPSLF